MTTSIEIRPYLNFLNALLVPADGDALWLKFGELPPGEKECLSCGKLIPRGSGRFCSYDCFEEFRSVSLVCHVCSNKFTLHKSEYAARIKRRKVPYFFCSRKCYGSYFGHHYGRPLGSRVLRAPRGAKKFIPLVLRKVLRKKYMIKYHCVFCNQVFSDASSLGGHRTKTGELSDRENMERVLKYRVAHTLTQTLAHFHISEDVLKGVIRDYAELYRITLG